MSDTAGLIGKQIRVILPDGPPELTPAVARNLLAILIELTDKTPAQTTDTRREAQEPPA
ncbi:hypothetical protein M8542_14400 [Amycolatopsis sp. OK19-0408]|uniref:Uncharacterized protein n=1 Tax=Amycolatopsis iheyensis TaxID=2945988 RepID=A0A9X2SIR6_9PSEU|nr:hypothetical protein [Amycolatopsis iheyensis]MCR6484012.1 hypothetical protein [Amycolatopsis iheyensis]